MFDKQNVKIRPAVRSDSNYFLNLRNRSDSRTASPTSTKVELHSHQKWFNEKLKVQHYFLGIVLAENLNAGIIRLEPQGKNFLVSIVIDPRFRGMGLCALALTELRRNYQKNGVSIFAKVSRNNKASLNCFLSAGYALSNLGNRFIWLCSK